MEVDKLPHRIPRLACACKQAGTEKRNPSLKIASLPYAHKPIVVFAPVSFEFIRGVDDRLGERPIMYERKEDEQTPEASVAVEERVRGFKLVVHQSGLDDWIDVVTLVDEKLEVAKCLLHILRVGRDIRGLIERAAVWSDPVLSRPELARRLVGASVISKQCGMDGFEQPHTEWQFLHERGRLLHRSSVVDDVG